APVTSSCCRSRSGDSFHHGLTAHGPEKPRARVAGFDPRETWALRQPPHQPCSFTGPPTTGQAQPGFNISVYPLLCHARHVFPRSAAFSTPSIAGADIFALH